MRMIKFPSIEQFRNVVKNVQMKARYKGQDDFGEAIFDPFAKLPTLKFEGTVKLHGTNFSYVSSQNDGDWFQSRENIITPEKDNAGSAMFGYVVKNTLDSIVNEVHLLIDSARCDVIIFGEWCGGSIQKGVALNQLRKMFVIFGIAVIYSDSHEGHKTYLTRDEVEKVTDLYVTKPSSEIDGSMPLYCIWDFQTFEMMIDFENPHESQNNLNRMTMDVEEECPVGKAFFKQMNGAKVWLENGKVQSDKELTNEVRIKCTEILNDGDTIILEF